MQMAADGALNAATSHASSLVTLGGGGGGSSGGADGGGAAGGGDGGAKTLVDNVHTRGPAHAPQRAKPTATAAIAAAVALPRAKTSTTDRRVTEDIFMRTSSMVTFAPAVRASRSNAVRAGVEDITTFSRGDVANLAERSGRGLVVLNPPYGHRLEGSDDTRGNSSKLLRSYSAWGASIRAAAPGWDIALVSPDDELARAFGATNRPKLRFRNGGISVALWMLSGA